MRSMRSTHRLVAWAGAPVAAADILARPPRAVPPFAPRSEALVARRFGVAVHNHVIGPEPAVLQTGGDCFDPESVRHFLRLAHRCTSIVAHAGGAIRTSDFLAVALADAGDHLADTLLEVIDEYLRQQSSISCSKKLAGATRAALSSSAAPQHNGRRATLSAGALVVSNGRHVVAATLSGSLHVHAGSYPEYERCRWDRCPRCQAARRDLL
jgi:hypothetical protein